VELLDAERAREAIGSAAYTGALLDRRAGTIQPLAYARGLATAAIAQGAQIFRGSPVSSVEEAGNAWKVVTAAGSVTAPQVIVATDAYSSNVWSELKKEQVMLPYFNLATPPLPTALRNEILPGGQGAWDTKDVLSSFRFDAAGRLVFGSVGALRGTGTTIHRDWGKRALARLFPQLSGIEFDYEWFGWIGMTDNALPRFHRLGRNIHSISGFNGRGIAPGTTFGRDLARLALGELKPEDLALPLTEITPPWLRVAKEAAYEQGSQLVHFVGARFNS
jgi:glycine/D-amino acid oxidase-like deaminating enzyme